MLNQEKYRPELKDTPTDIKEYVLSSNETHTIKEFVELAFKHADIKGVWHGNGISEEFSITREDVEKHNSGK